MAMSAGNEAALKAAQDVIAYGTANNDQSAVDLGTKAKGQILASAGESDEAAYLKQTHAARLEKDLGALKSAYRQADRGYQAEAKQLAGIYQTAKNAAAVQNAQEKRAFDERSAAGGLSSGANAQAQLAMSSVYQSRLGALDAERAQKESDIQHARMDLLEKYSSEVAGAKAQNKADLAEALYKERLAQREQDREDALLKQKATAAEAEYARELALKYKLIDPKNIGQINSLADLASLGPVSTATGTPAGGNGYDNEGLTPNQVAVMQKYFGLSADGKWGPNSQKTTGLSAKAAWQKYLNSKNIGSTVGVPEVSQSVYAAGKQQVDPVVVREFNDLLEGGADARSVVETLDRWVQTGRRGMTKEWADALLGTVANWGRAPQ